VWNVAKWLKGILGTWAFLLLINGSALDYLIVSLFFIPNVWGVLIGSSVMALGFYWYYVQHVKKKQPRYPLVAPEGKADFYLPRTKIPRPVHADFREIEEKKRKFAKVKKLTRKKVVRKKK
jgi:hypothetical protein